MNKVSKKDQAWYKIFDTLKILEHIDLKGYFDISATTIKEISHEEPRLITKIDFREELPNIMHIHSLSVLAIKNGLYRIAKNDPFVSINKEPATKIHTVELPTQISTIDPLNIKSESAALDIAKIAGILDHVFQEKTDLTIRGRLRGSLDFSIGSTFYNVDRVQIEVDGGYEGKNTLNLIESKIGYRNNINIRQLLYPELMWKKQVNKKKINSFIFYYQDDLFRFIPFEYDGKNFYARHEKEKAFRFRVEQDFRLKDLKKQNEVLVDYEAPFPQANDFEKIHAILLKIENENCPTKRSVISNFDVVDRQADYYFNALRWLGLCQYNGDCIELSKKGMEVVSLDIHNRMVAIVKIIFSEPIFFNELRSLPTDKAEYKKWKMGPITAKRRLSTVRMWIKYFNNFFG